MSDAKVIVITGASRGIGLAVARWLKKTDAAVILVARSKKTLEDAAGQIDQGDDRTLAIAADVADPEACAQIVNQTIARFGRIDGLVNNAGIVAPLGVLATADPTAWHYNLEVNVMGPFYLVRAALGALRKRGGRVINVSSGASEIAIEGNSAYCVAKAALNHFTRVLAAEEPQVTALAIRPGVVDTHMQTILRQEAPQVMPAKWGDYYQDLKRQGKLESPEIPGRSIAWLALAAPHALSGQYVSYDDPNIAKPAAQFFGQ